MSGQVVLSSSGRQSRMQWWTHCQADGNWTLCLPTAKQVVLTHKAFPLLARFFSSASTLGELAGAWAVELGLAQSAVGDARLNELLDQLAPGADTAVVARQIRAWHEEGLLLSSAVLEKYPSAKGPAMTRLEQLEAAIGGAVPTEAYCQLAVAESLVESPHALPRLYLENVFTFSPAERQLLQALSRRTDVIVRVRDVEAPPVEAVFRKTVEELIADGEWTGQQDAPPDDWRARLAVPEILFAGAPPPLPEASRLYHRRFASVADELGAIAEKVRALVAAGASVSTLVIALPGTPAYRAQAQTALAGLAAEIDVIAHADLTSRVSHDLFFAGSEGAADARPAAGGWSADAPENLPTYLLDAIEQSRGPLYVSSVDGFGHAQADVLTHAAGGALPGW